MDEFILKKKMAEELRERIYTIPRRHREYEFLYQPTIQINNSSAPDTKIIVKFTLGFENFVYPCKMLVQADGAYLHVGSVGPYLDKLFIRGRSGMICSEFLHWMQFARYGTVDGKFAFIIHHDKPVGFMVQPENDAFCYVFCRNEIASCGIKPDKVFEAFSFDKYRGDMVGGMPDENTYIPNEAYGKGIKPISSIKPEFRRTLIWSFLCRQSLMI